MDSNRLDRVEDMLTQLIKAVGETNVVVQETNKVVREMKVENEQRHKEFIVFKELSEKRHQEFIEFKNISKKRHIEVMDRFDDIELDQDVIWNKSVENERKISRLMRYKS